MKKKIRLWFPDYVFIEFKLTGQQFLKVMSSLKSKQDIICVLKYSDTEITMKQSERKMLLSLCNKEHCIESLYGVIEGEKYI